MRYILAIIMLCAMPVQEKTVMLGPVTYRIIHDGSREIDPALFHETFMQEFNTLSNRFGTAIGNDISIVLCGGGWIFKEVTGCDPGTAGVYRPAVDTFYFQDPAALLRKDILAATVRHELMHYIINSAHKENYNPGNLWLEESFCLALFPVATYAGIQSPAEAETVLKLKEYLNCNLKSTDTVKRRKAYALAAGWGRFFVKEAGERKVFRALTGQDVQVRWDILFDKYRSTRHNNDLP